MMVALRDEETQIKGVVGTAMFIGMTPAPDDQQHIMKMALLASSIPMYLPGGHICTDNSMLLPLATAFLSCMDRFMKTRHKIHRGASNPVISYLRRRTGAPILTLSSFLACVVGTILECIYELMTFGIPTRVLPFNIDGETSLENHHKWIERQRILEGSSDGTKREAIPGPFDVLLGREKISQEHVGNVRYHFVIDAHRDHFESSSVREKTAITREIVQQIKASGGRFLKLDNAGWEEVSDEAARKKVASAFRSKRKSGKGPGNVHSTPTIKSKPRPLGSPTHPRDEETALISKNLDTSRGYKRSR
jgi:hypothetical protein